MMIIRLIWLCEGYDNDCDRPMSILVLHAVSKYRASFLLFCNCVSKLIKCRFSIIPPSEQGNLSYYPVSTGIFPHSLPEWAFRARPGLWRICLYPKVARIAEQKFGNR